MIGTLIQFLGQRLLRRHVFHRADQRAGLRHAVAFERARQTEVHHQHAAGRIRIMFCGFRSRWITPTLCAASSARHTCSMISTASSGGNFLPLVDEGAQVLALDEFHGDELHAIAFAEVVNADDVAVRDPLREQ